MVQNFLIIKYLAAQGKWAGGRTLYGYRWMPGQKQWETIPEEVKVTRYIWRTDYSFARGTNGVR